jgi:ferredoxin
VTWRLRVDPVACDRFGHCAEMLPERIWLDEWGFPVLDDDAVTPALLDLAEEAVRVCPRKALRLVRQHADRR